MCTAILFFRAHPQFPVIIAANRDEQYARPVRGVQAVAPGIVAGIDAEKGGSWAGATAAGGFALLTNRRRRDPTVKAPRSRGEIVLACLRAGSRAAMRDAIGALDPRAFGPFNLVFGDAGGIDLAVSEEGESAIAISPVPEGIHVLTHESIDAPPVGKIARAQKLFAPLASVPWPDFQPAAHAALGDHQHPGFAEHTPPPGPPPQPTLSDALSAICVHTQFYGTRSATLLAMEKGRTAHYLYAPGPPCETAFTDVTPLLHP